MSAPGTQLSAEFGGGFTETNHMNMVRFANVPDFKLCNHGLHNWVGLISKKSSTSLIHSDGREKCRITATTIQVRALCWQGHRTP